MTDARMKIIIEALNFASEELKEIQGDLKGIDTESQDADKGMQGLATALKAAGIAALAFKAGKMAYELGLLGAQAERTEQGFETISGGASDAAANLGAMMVATDGAIDRTTAMSMANQMMMMGIADTSDALAKNAEMATRLGRAMGVDAIPAMENWNAMMANQSLPRLDTYGISSGKVRARINELMAATEGLTREQAFNTAVMEQGQIALGRLGESVEDNALSVEQAQAAYADLKAEIGMGFAGAVGGANTVVGKFTRQWGDNLRIMRENSKEIGTLRGNLGMLGDVLGFNNTVFDKSRRAQEEAAEAAEFGAVMAGGYAQRLEHQNHIIGDSGAAWEQYSAAIRASEDAAADYANEAAELYEAQLLANEAAFAAETAFLGAAAGLGEIGDAAFVAGQLQILSLALEAGTLTTDEYTEAQRRLLTGFGLLTEAEETAQTKINNLTQQFIDGKIDAEAYALAIEYVKNGIDNLQSKELMVRVKFDVARPPSFITDAGDIAGGTYQTFAAGGYIQAGAYGIVGERGPEIVRATRSGTQVTPISQVDRSIHLGGVTITTQAGVQSAMRQLSQMEF